MTSTDCFGVLVPNSMLNNNCVQDAIARLSTEARCASPNLAGIEKARADLRAWIAYVTPKRNK